MPKQLSTNLANQVVIIPDSEALAQATEGERESAIGDLFMSLAMAITKQGCSVNIDDPSRIVVTKKLE